MDKTKRPLNSDEMLESIFYYMNRIIEEQEFSKTISLLTDLGSTLVCADRASFWFWDQPKKQYWTMAAVNNGKITVDEKTGIVGAAISQGETIVINEPYEDQRFNNRVDKETGYVTKSILCMPVTNTDGEVIGAFQAINKLNENGEAGAFDEKDVKHLSLVAVFCGKALESYLLYNKVLYDQLTALKNRRGFFEFYKKRILPIISKTKVSLVMCDIDFFKKVNDVYGHNAGDQVLRHVATIFQENIGVDDEIVRWGGEEFLFLLPQYDEVAAASFAEKIRQKIEASVCTFEEQNIQITMSFGVTSICGECTPEENIKHADECLYLAKTTGRNKVVRKNMCKKETR